MARCNRCNKFMLIRSDTGYCENCFALIQEEERKRQEEEARYKAEEERKRQEEEARCKAEEERKRQEEEARCKDEETHKCEKEENNNKDNYKIMEELENKLQETDKIMEEFFAGNTQKTEEYYALQREYYGLKNGITNASNCIEKHNVQKKEQRDIEKTKKAILREKARRNCLPSINEARMFAILQMEAFAGNPNLKDESFVEEYSHLFPNYVDEQLIELKNSILTELNSEEKQELYKSIFSQQSLEDRFNYSAGRLYEITKGMACLNIDTVADQAIHNSAQYFSADEKNKVKILMSEKTKETRTQLENQMKAVDLQWINFETARKCLLLKITPLNKSEFNDKCKFQTKVDQNMVEVCISTQGGMITASVSNIFSWFWNVPVLDIWKAAFRTGVVNSPKDIAREREEIAEQAITQIYNDYGIEENIYQEQLDELQESMKECEKLADEMLKLLQ